MRKVSIINKKAKRSVLQSEYSYKRTTGHVSEFTYDSHSHRISEKETDSAGHSTTVYNLWCGDRLCAQTDAAGNVINRFYPQGELQNGTAYFYAQDQVGSVMAIVGLDGKVKGRRQYSSYGQIINKQDAQPIIAYADLNPGV